ncbi:hypothetical protein REPUB_Repub15cG0118600 [Reevesia pubescens]
MVVTTTTVAANDMANGDWSETRTCVVLGGRGFLGRSLVARLLQLGGWTVRVADSSSESLELDPSSAFDSLLSDALCSGQASFCNVDVRDTSQIIKGAKNVINACRECKVRRLVYNSSADVVFDCSQDILNADESLTCPGKFQDLLIDLKFQAEGLIRLANNIDGLLTCVLRPSIVFGLGDTQFVPLLVNLAKSGLAKFITGSAENMSDFTYAENVAHAHICAAETLDSRVVSVAGKAFFITNLEPVMFWEFVSLILEGLGYQRPFIKVPSWMVSYILSLHQCIHDKLRFGMHKYSLPPHYIVQLASHSRTFDCSAAQKHLGYSPVVSLQDGVQSTIESFSHLAKDSSFMRYCDFNGQSKAEKLLGSRIVADVLLWRDKKRTFTCFLTLALVFYWFFLCGRTFISSAAKLLLLVTVILYGYGILPSRICGFSVQRISSTCFEIPESTVKSSMRSLAYIWNRGVCNIRLFAKGEKDWSKFFKVAVFLYFIQLILSYSLAVLIGIELDGLGKVMFCGIMESKEMLRRILPAFIKSFLQNYNILHQ